MRVRLSPSVDMLRVATRPKTLRPALITERDSIFLDFSLNLRICKISALPGLPGAASSRPSESSYATEEGEEGRG
jgi:hypothetical protein